MRRGKLAGTTVKSILPPAGKSFRWNEYKRAHEEAYRSGRALKRHCDAAHNGKFIDSCPACREVKEKSC
jgi:hypothetical protein